MAKRWFGILVLLGLVLWMIVPIASAQGVNKSIRGSVREDKDGDGKCSDGATITGVPIEFVSNDGQWSHVLYTGDDGTYGLVAVGDGTWTVSAKPTADWVVTSAKSLKPVISDEQPVVLNVSFCVRKTSAVAGGGTTILPQSGSPISTSIILGLSTGVMFLLAGLVMEGRRRWVN
jgi:hypothetical protein